MIGILSSAYVRQCEQGVTFDLFGFRARPFTDPISQIGIEISKPVSTLDGFIPNVEQTGHPFRSQAGEDHFATPGKALVMMLAAQIFWCTAGAQGIPLNRTALRHGLH